MTGFLDAETRVSVSLRAGQWDRILDLLLASLVVAPDGPVLAAELSAELTRAIFTSSKRRLCPKPSG